MTWTAVNSEGFDSPAALAVDTVALAVSDAGHLRLLALKTSPAGPVLIGGFVHPTESAELAVRRVLKEKAGIDDLGLEQLAAFSDPGRDPRGWIPTVAHLALVREDTVELNSELEWLTEAEWPRLAFDHASIAAAGLERVRGKLWWSNVAAKMLPAEFSISEARMVYQAVADRQYDPSTFGRDLAATGLIEPTGNTRSMPRGRPARLFKFASEEPSWGAGRRKRIR